jgi:5'-methylthioadenosine phosphorylase
MEGPAFSSRAESLTRRRLGYGLIGMTASPEAKLAREAELCYACAAMVTDYDCWKRGEEVSIDKVIATMDANSANAQRLIASAIAPLAALERGCPCPRALENAVLTRTEDIPARTFERLSLLIGRRVRP